MPFLYRMDKIIGNLAQELETAQHKDQVNELRQKFDIVY